MTFLRFPIRTTASLLGQATLRKHEIKRHSLITSKPENHKQHSQSGRELWMVYVTTRGLKDSIPQNWSKKICAWMTYKRLAQFSRHLYPPKFWL